MRVRLTGLVCVFGLMSSIAAAQDGGPGIGCLFANNDSSPNMISRFRAFDDGTLTLLAPAVPTGGNGSDGGYYASPRLVYDAEGQCLFAGNPDSSNIRAFSLSVADCDLSPAGGLVPSGGLAGGLGMGLDLDRVNHRLYVVNPGSNNVAGFDIGADCTLTSIGPPAAGPPGTDTPDDIIVRPTGTDVTVTHINQDRVTSWYINKATGVLTPAEGCFPCPPAGGVESFAAGMEFDFSGTKFFIGKANFGFTRVNVYGVDEVMGWQHIPGSPYAFSIGSNSNVVELGNSCLLVTNQASNTLTSLNVAPGGGLSPAGGAISIGGGVFPTDMEFGCQNEAASYPLWIAKGDPRQVTALLWSGCGMSAPVGTFLTSVPGRFLLRGIEFVPNNPATCNRPTRELGGQ